MLLALIILIVNKRSSQRWHLYRRILILKLLSFIYISLLVFRLYLIFILPYAFSIWNKLWRMISVLSVAICSKTIFETESFFFLLVWLINGLFNWLLFVLLKLCLPTGDNWVKRVIKGHYILKYTVLWVLVSQIVD